ERKEYNRQADCIEDDRQLRVDGALHVPRITMMNTMHQRSKRFPSRTIETFGRTVKQVLVAQVLYEWKNRRYSNGDKCVKQFPMSECQSDGARGNHPRQQHLFPEETT